jgi:hypothetical protein
VDHRLAHAPLTFGWRAVEEVVVERGEQTTKAAELDLRERQDARRLVAVRCERRDGQLLFLERVEQCVRGIGWWIDIAPAPRDGRVGDPRESR